MEKDEIIELSETFTTHEKEYDDEAAFASEINALLQINIQEGINSSFMPENSSQNPRKSIKERFLDFLRERPTPLKDDKLPPSHFTLSLIFLSIIVYVFDVGSDILVGVNYLLNGQTWYAGLTFFFVFCPVFVIGIMGMSTDTVKDGRNPLVVFIFSLLQVEMIYRYIKTLRLGFKSRKAYNSESEDNQNEVIRLNKSVYSKLESISTLRMIESFMEAAPQVTLQLYILHNSFEENLTYTGNTYFQLKSVMASIVSVAWTLSTKLQFSKINIPNYLKILFWMGSFYLISSRIFALVLFALAWPILVIPALAIRFVSRILLWNLWRDETEDNFLMRTVVEKSILCWFYFFAPVLPDDIDFFRMNRNRICIIYFVVLIENSIYLAFWLFGIDWTLTSPETIRSRNWGFFGVYVTLFIGFVSLLIFFSGIKSIKLEEENHS